MTATPTHRLPPPHQEGGNRLYISILRRLIGFVALVLAVCTSNAQGLNSHDYTVVEVKADSAEIHFHKSSSKLDLNLDGNGSRIDTLMRQIRKLTGQDSTFVVSTLRVIGSASPEGSEKINRRLSEKRARALFDYFADHITLPESITDFEYLGRNWKGLYTLVEADPSVPYQSEVLDLLQKALTSERLTVHESNHLLYRLKIMRNGVPYSYLYHHLFPALRYSYLYVEYEKRIHREITQLVLKTIEEEEALQNDSTTFDEPAEEISETEKIIINEPEKIIINEPQQRVKNSFEKAPDSPKSFYMDIRTNMLYDLAAVPNIGAEFYLGKNISILADWMYSWWDSNPRHRYWRIYGGDLGIRWWFGNKAHTKPLTGHHLGIYGGVLTFDFEWGGTGYMGGVPGGTLWDRCLINSGIEYGYSLPIAPHLNIDFSLGLGYLGGNYIKYFPFDNEYFREKEFRLNYFGPTKAEVSLIWLIGRGNHNVKKGGEK